MNAPSIVKEPESIPKPHRRSPWASLLLLFGLGLPFIYCGDFLLGSFLTVLWPLWMLVTGYFLSAHGTISLYIIHSIVSFALVLSIFIFAIKRIRNANRLNRPRVRFVWAWTVLVAICGGVLSGQACRIYWWGAYRIPSSAMEETVLTGDYILASKNINGDVLSRGAILIHKYPRNPAQHNIKRCVGLPGDTIEIRDKSLFVNGERFPDPPHAKYSDWRVLPQGVQQRDIVPVGAGNRDNYGPVVVPAGNYFMLGDNRDNSADSRYWGFLPRNFLVGRPIFIYFSWDKQSRSVRWNRIGQRIR